jgi:hypothetical protein
MTEKTDAKTGLLIEPPPEKESSGFTLELHRSLEQAQAEVIRAVTAAGSGPRSFESARKIVEDFRPIPWFIWRISNFVFSSPSAPDQIPEGMVLGLRRLLFAAASDLQLGKGRKINNLREALQTLSPDLVAAAAVVHAMCRRLRTTCNERLFSTVTEEALVRAQIGLFVGKQCAAFGPGRGMLAGFLDRWGYRF